MCALRLLVIWSLGVLYCRRLQGEVSEKGKQRSKEKKLEGYNTTVDRLFCPSKPVTVGKTLGMTKKSVNSDATQRPAAGAMTCQHSAGREPQNPGDRCHIWPLRYSNAGREKERERISVQDGGWGFERESVRRMEAKEKPRHHLPKCLERWRCTCIWSHGGME